MAPRSEGEQFYPGPSPASPATRAPHGLQGEGGESPRQSTEKERKTSTREGGGRRREEGGLKGRKGGEEEESTKFGK